MGTLLQWMGPETGTKWNSTRVYQATSETGSFSLIATVTPIATTQYWDATSGNGLWYKIAFYDSVGTVEGPQSPAFYAGAGASMYTNPTELRKFMQIQPADFPNDEDVTLLLQQAHVQLSSDAGGTHPIADKGKLKLLALFLGGSFVCQSLAMRALSKGYISVSLEGAQIMKAHDALMRMGELYKEKYQEQLAKDCVDYAATSFLPDVVNATSVQDLIDMMNGVTDGLDYQSSNVPSTRNSRNP